MKKIIFVLMIILCPLSVFAETYPKVTSLNAEISDANIIYQGEMENGSYAVMCKLYNEKNEEIDLLSSKVDDSKFTGQFTVQETGEYTIACANYEGGEIKKVSAIVSEKEETYKIEFNTNGGNKIEDMTIKKGSKIDTPTPTKDGYLFAGWYVDHELTTEYVNNPVDRNMILYAKWYKEESLKKYTITDSKGNSISFLNEEGKSFTFSIIDYMPLTDEELTELGATREEYNEVKNKITTATKNYGTLLAFYEIEVGYQDGELIHNGPFKIKIKLTEEMKKYDTFKLVYVDDDYSIEEPIALKIEGDYIVGTLPHLSAYALLGSKSEVKSANPQTLDSIYMWVGALAISIIGISVTKIMISKSKKASK